MKDVLITYDDTQDADPMLGYSIKETQEIVRCRDCRYCMMYWLGGYCDYFKHKTDGTDGFCAWGERK